MKAVQVEQYVKGPSDLTVSTVPNPSPQPDEYLISIRACGANFFDLLQIRGKYQWQPALPWVGGSEFSGVVLQTPSDSKYKKFQKGDRIFGSAQGAFAQRVCVKEANMQPIPEGWSFREASALYLTGPTGYAAMVIRARVQKGELQLQLLPNNPPPTDTDFLGDWALIHGAAGGVGLSAVQVAKAHGAHVIATSTGSGIAACRKHGADHVIDYASTPAWDKEVMKLTSGHGADAVFDPVGCIGQSMKCAAFDARLVCIGFVGGEIEAIKMNRILLKNVAVVGLHWGAYVQYDPATIVRVWEGLFELIRQGKFRSTVFEEKFDGLGDVGRALAWLEGKKTWGKAVVDVEEETGGGSKL